MAKTKKVVVKHTRTSLKGNITKRKSIRQSAGMTPKLKKLSLTQAKTEVYRKMLNFSASEEPAELENETGANVTFEIKSPKHFIKAPKSPINLKQVESGLSALLEYVKKTNEKKTELFDDAQPIFLQITSVKVPKTPNRQVRLTLKHSLLIESSDICLIVKDVGKAKDHDATIEHYEELLKHNGVTNIKTVMPYHQFKTEYGNQYELVRKLLGLYDYFLVDGSVTGYVTHRLGKIFLEKRKMPTSVKMNASNLKEHIEISLKKTLMKLHAKSDYYIVQVGHTKMSEKDVFENISEIIDELGRVFPGGLDNIRSLGVKTDTSLTVPVYLTLKNKSSVNVPIALAKYPKHFKKVTGELTTFLDKDVTVLPTGEIIVTNQGQDEEFPLESDDDQTMWSDFEESEEGTDHKDEDLPGGSDEESDNENAEEIKEQVKEKPTEDNEEEGGGILDQAEEIYLNQYEQEQNNTRKTRKANRVDIKIKEAPVKKSKRPIKERKENTNAKTSKKVDQKKGPETNKQKKVTKTSKQENLKKNKENVLARAEELYLNEYKQEQTVAVNTRKTRATKTKQKEEVPLKKSKKPTKNEDVKNVPAKENLKITKNTKAKKGKKEDAPNILEQEDKQEQTRPKRQKGSAKTNDPVQGENLEELNVKKTRKTKAKIEEVVPAKKTKTVEKVPVNKKPVPKSKEKSVVVPVADDKTTQNPKKRGGKKLLPPDQDKIEENTKKGNKTTKTKATKTVEVSLKVAKVKPEVSENVGKKSKKFSEKKNENDEQSKKGKEKKIKSPTLKAKAKMGKRKSTQKKILKVKVKK